MKIPKELEGKFLSLLLPGIPVCEIRLVSVGSDEIIAEYDDGEILHVNVDHLLAYWVDEKRASRKLAAAARASKRAAEKNK
jgi:hypothetical protein